jgi:hypothetical protein
MVSGGMRGGARALVSEWSAAPGDIVECGTWRGGMSAAMASRRARSPLGAFRGAGRRPKAMRWSEEVTAEENFTADEASAQAAMRRANARDYETIKAWFADTVPNWGSLGRPTCGPSPLTAIGTTPQWCAWSTCFPWHRGRWKRHRRLFCVGRMRSRGARVPPRRRYPRMDSFDARDNVAYVTRESAGLRRVDATHSSEPATTACRRGPECSTTRDTPRLTGQRMRWTLGHRPRRARTVRFAPRSAAMALT